jgi:Hypothetical protein (DUF2513)
MKRDLELIRTILMEVEQNNQPLRPIKIEAHGYSPDEVSYHVWQLYDAGYVTAEDRSHLAGMVWLPKSLTWEGHNFLDATRNDGIWRQVKARLKDKGLDAPLSVIQELATKLVTSALLGP